LEPFLGPFTHLQKFKFQCRSQLQAQRGPAFCPLPVAACLGCVCTGSRWLPLVSLRAWDVSHRIFGTVERSVRRWVPTSARTMAAPYGARRACPADLKKWAERIVRRWMMRCRVPRRCNWPTQRRAHGPFMPAIPARFIRLRCSAPSSLQRQVLVSES